MARPFLIALGFAFSTAVSSAFAAEPPAASAPAPDEDWARFPPEKAAPPDAFPERPVDIEEQPPPPRPPAISTQSVQQSILKHPPEEPNNVSLYGAPTLGKWNRGLGVYMGFPLLGARFAIGLLNRLDAGVAFDSMYGVMNDFRLHLKWQFMGQKNWSAAAALEGGPALFAQSPQAEGNGPRWLTGRRDWNIAPGVIVSYRGDAIHSPRLFLDMRAPIAIDTEPFAPTPLPGPLPAVTVAGNFTARAGAEMPFSSKTSFLFQFGFDIHGRPIDSLFMIAVAVGIVTSL